MDTQILKVFAERLHAHLEQHHLSLKHGQTLDLVAAIPGLRNWPEVNAFPAKVAVVQWDCNSAERLARRIASRYSLNFPPEELLLALAPSPASLPQVWPDGPEPGVYVTTSQEAVDAAIAKYEAATDGALLFAENAGRSAEGAIDLGEYGLFSRGMDRLPSGTLVVVGPLPMTQESWEDNRDRLTTAAGLAYASSLRIIVLVDTPLPDNLHSDIALLLSDEDDGSDGELADVLGVVTETGDLRVVQPFVDHRVEPDNTQPFTTKEQLPMPLENALRLAVEKRPYGIIVLGVTPGDKARKAQLEAVLPLTEYAGPAVRIQPTFRSGYGKDDTPLSPHFVGLPIFPSIESAYAHGYRRMVIESPHHGAAKAMSQHVRDVCFLVHSYSTELIGAWYSSLPGRFEDPSALDAIIAVLCVADVPGKSETFTVCDAFIGGTVPTPNNRDFDNLSEHIEAHRVVRWQEQLAVLLDTGKLTLAQAKKALRRHDVEAYLSARKAGTH